MLLEVLFAALAAVFAPVLIVVSLCFHMMRFLVLPLLHTTAFACLFLAWWLCSVVGLAVLALADESFKQFVALGTLFD
jgi:hypothetical protein